MEKPSELRVLVTGDPVDNYLYMLYGKTGADYIPDATLDAKSLSAIKMPNRNMFVGDPRPDVKNPECMRNC